MNVHRQTEGHLELVTGGRTSTAVLLAKVHLHATSRAVQFSGFAQTYPRLDAISIDYWGEVSLGGFEVRRRWVGS